MTISRGSAAAPHGVPESAGVSSDCEAALRATNLVVIESLELAASLARRANESLEPARAALLIAGVLDDLAPELRTIRAAARGHLASP